MFGYNKLSQPEQQALAVFAEGLGVAVVFIFLYVLRPNVITGIAAGVTVLWVFFGAALFVARLKDLT